MTYISKEIEIPNFHCNIPPRNFKNTPNLMCNFQNLLFLLNIAFSWEIISPKIIYDMLSKMGYLNYCNRHSEVIKSNGTFSSQKCTVESEVVTTLERALYL